MSAESLLPQACGESSPPQQPQQQQSSDATVAAGATALSPPRSGAVPTSSFMRERLQAFSSSASSSASPSLASSSPSPTAAATPGAATAAAVAPVAPGTVAAAKAAFASPPAASAAAAGNKGSTVGSSVASASVAPKTVTSVVAQLTQSAGSAPARPTHVRRNSAPKGSVRSLLSFWRTQEDPAQDARVAAQRQSILQQRDAKALQHQQQLLAAANAKSQAQQNNAANNRAKQTPVEPLMDIPPTVSASRATLLAVPAASPAPSHSPSMSPSYSPSSSSLLSPAPSTLSPSSPHEEADSAILLGGVGGGGADCTVATGDGREQSNASSFLSPPISSGVVAAVAESTPGDEASHTLLLPAAPTLPPSAPLFAASGAAQGMSRCMTDFGVDGDGGGHVAGVVLPQQQQLQLQQRHVHDPIAVTAESYRASRSGSLNAGVAPPLQRDVTDYGAMMRAAATPEGAGDAHSGAVYPAGTTVPPAAAATAGPNPFPSALPPLTREVTDPLGGPTTDWDGVKQPQLTDDAGVPIATALKQQQQQVAAPPPQMQALPLLSRLVTDPCDDQGQLLPTHSSLAAIESDEAAKAASGSRRVSVSLSIKDPAFADAHAALFPSPQRLQQQQAQQQQQQQQQQAPPAAALLTRIATDVEGMGASPLCTPLPRGDLGSIQATCAFVNMAPHSTAPPLSRLATDPSHTGVPPVQEEGQQHCLPSVAPLGIERVATEFDLVGAGALQPSPPTDQQQQQQQQQMHFTPAPLLTRVLTELDMQQMDASPACDAAAQSQQYLDAPQQRSRPVSISAAPAPLMTRVLTEIDMHAMAQADDNEGSHAAQPAASDAAASAQVPLMPAPMPLMQRVHTEIDMTTAEQNGTQGEEGGQVGQQQHDKTQAPSQQQHGRPSFLTRQATNVRRPSGDESRSRSRSRSLSPHSRSHDAYGSSLSASPVVHDHPATAATAAGEEVDSDADTEAGDEEPNWTEEEEPEQEQEQEAADAVGSELALPPGARGARGSVVAGSVLSPPPPSAQGAPSHLSVKTGAGSGSYSNLVLLDPSTPSEFGSEAPMTPSSRNSQSGFGHGHGRTPSELGLVMPVPPSTPLSVVQALQSPLPVPPSPSFQATAAGATAGEKDAGAPAGPPVPSSSGTENVSAVGVNEPVADPTAAAAAASTMASFRAKVEGELLSTEESYVSSLGLLVNYFIHPLKTNQEVLGITSGQIGLIFSNVELLYGFHCIFLADLTAAVKESRRAAAEAAAAGTDGLAVPSSATVAAGAAAAALASSPQGQGQGHARSGSVFGSKHAPPRLVSEVILKCADFLRMYTGYLAGYSVALDTIAGLRNNGKFTAFLLQQRAAAAEAAKAAAIAAGNKPSGSGLDLMSYLIMPVQRIPRYLLLLKELLRYTPRGHPELATLQDAYTKVQHIARHINEQQRSIENMSVLLSIQNSIESSSLADLGQLMVPHRRLVRSGVLHKLTSGLITKSHVRRVYLFNDILLWCETAASPDAPSAATPGANGGAGSAATGAEKFRGLIELDSATVREHFGKGGKVGFRLSTSTRSSKKEKEVVFICRSSDEKQGWLGDIRAAQTSTAEAAEEARRRRMDSRVKNAVGATSAHATSRLSVPNFPTSAHSEARHTREGSASVIGMSGEDLIALQQQSQSQHQQQQQSLPNDSVALHGFVSNRLKELPVTSRARPASMAVVSPRAAAAAAAAAAAGGGVGGGVGAGTLAAMATRNTLRSGAAGLSATATPQQFGALAAALAPSPSASSGAGAGGSSTSATASATAAAVAEPQVETMSIEEWTVCEEMAAGRRTRARPRSF